jgi:trypsin-like peptidase
MRRLLLAAALLAAASARVEAACIDPSAFVHSTVNLSKSFGEQESDVTGVVAIRGTAWFLSPRLLVTAAHVAEAMRLSAQEWKDVDMRDGDSSRTVPVRILRVAGSAAERIAVLELATAVPTATALQRRSEALIPDERLVSVAYPKGQLRFAGGRFVRYGEDDPRLAGTALLEMYDGDDRLVLDHGASGAAVLDCEGRAVAVVSTLITQTLRFMSNMMRTSTPWQQPNVVSIPISVLD